jgi:hypothetical protein
VQKASHRIPVIIIQRAEERLFELKARIVINEKYDTSGNIDLRLLRR